MNKTIKEMLPSFDALTTVQQDYHLIDRQEEQLNNMVQGVKLYREYFDMTGGLLEKGRVTPIQDYAPNPEPLQIRGVDGTRLEHGLDPDRVAEFQQNGILGPYELMSEEQTAELYDFTYSEYRNGGFEENYMMGDHLKSRLKEMDNFSMNYAGAYQALNYRRYSDLLSGSRITDKIASLIGDNLICWRSQFFEIKPGQAGTFWHQASTFKETSSMQKLTAPSNIDPRMIQLTAWIALSDTDKTSACMQFLLGSHAHDFYEKLTYEYFENLVYFFRNKPDQEIYSGLKTLLYSPNIFHKTYLVLKDAAENVKWLFDGMKVKPYPMKAGLFILFSSMVCHASYGNQSEKSRLAMGGRYTSGDVKVYDGFTRDHLSTKAGNLEYPIDKLGCFQVRGKDQHLHNKIVF